MQRLPKIERENISGEFDEFYGAVTQLLGRVPNFYRTISHVARTFLVFEVYQRWTLIKGLVPLLQKAFRSGPIPVGILEATFGPQAVLERRVVAGHAARFQAFIV